MFLQYNITILLTLNCYPLYCTLQWHHIASCASVLMTGASHHPHTLIPSPLSSPHSFISTCVKSHNNPIKPHQLHLYREEEDNLKSNKHTLQGLTSDRDERARCYILVRLKWDQCINMLNQWSIVHLKSNNTRCKDWLGIGTRERVAIS